MLCLLFQNRLLPMADQTLGITRSSRILCGERFQQWWHDAGRWSRKATCTLGLSWKTWNRPFQLRYQVIRLYCNYCNCNSIHRVTLARRQGSELPVFESSFHLPNCLPHTVKAYIVSLIAERQPSKEAVNTDFILSGIKCRNSKKKTFLVFLFLIQSWKR